MRRAREAEEGLVAAREDVRAEAVRLLRGTPGPEGGAEVVRLTGRGPDTVRGLAG